MHGKLSDAGNWNGMKSPLLQVVDNRMKRLRGIGFRKGKKRLNVLAIGITL
jgi:hypothetical protein